MSSNKLLQSLSEDPQLEKQIGCMAGILQLFDRHQVLTGRRLYGHKRISAAAPKTQNSPSSNCGSPASETSGKSSENMIRLPSDDQNQKLAMVAASSEQQKSLPLSTPPTLSDVKSSSASARTPPLPVNDTSLHPSTVDQLPKISFEMARSSILTPRRLDSSRSLHEGRVNASQEGKFFARRSIDTAERAAAAARGALKELSRISTDLIGPTHHSDQVSIRDIVRSSLSKEQQAPKSTANPLVSGTSGPAFAPRMSNEASMCTSMPGYGKDMSRAQHTEAKSSAECSPAEKTMQSSNTFVSQAAGYSEASRPPRHYKTKPGTPTKSCADISESLRLLAKLREATPAYNAPLGSNANADSVGNKPQLAQNHVPHLAASSLDAAKEGSIAIASRPPLPRAPDRIPGRMSSCEPSRSSSVDALLQGVIPKSREIPIRSSLDGRGSSEAGFKVDCEAGTRRRLQNSQNLLNSRSMCSDSSCCDTDSLQEKRASFSCNVVAKLMGLDEMPNGELAEGAKLQNKLDLHVFLDQRDPRMLNTAMQEANPTFSQCGKYVSASFLPPKWRDDVKIAMDPEEEEEDSYLQKELLSHLEARTLNVRVGRSNSQARHRLATSESANSIGHPCYQPKNHHLMEDRPPHVLSPAARLCDQIEELQRADSLYKDVDRGIRTMEMKGSSQQDIEALKQLLGAIHLSKDYTHGAGSCLENLEMRAASGKQQPERVRSIYPHDQYSEQLPPPPTVIWKTKQMLNDEFYAHTQYYNPNSRGVPVKSHNRRVKNAIHSLPSSRQYTSAEICNQATGTRAETRRSPAPTHPPSYSTPRKANMGNECIKPVGTNNASTPNTTRRLASRMISPPNFISARFSTSPQTPFSPQSQQSYYSGRSWEGSSVSSTSSGPARDQHLLGISSYRVADKKNKQVERVERKKAGSGIPKDNEECKASPNTSVAKKSNSVVGLRLNAHRTVQSRTPLQSPDHVRSTMRSPTKLSARKAEEVKRKLNFVHRSPGRIRPLVEMESEDQDAEFVDKTMVSSINNNDPPKHYAHVDQKNGVVTETWHDEGPFSTPASHGNQLPNTLSNKTPTKTEGSPLLLLPCASVETNHNGQQAIFRRENTTGDMSSPATPICTLNGALKLPQVLQQENEDTESQGDKSTGSCEQPSPISVLEGPFYEDDASSPSTVLKLEEMKEEARGKDVSAGCELARSFPDCLLHRDLELRDYAATDFDYVKQVLAANMVHIPPNTDEKRSSMGALKLRSLEPHSFLELEEEILNSHGSCKSQLANMWRRRLLFDSGNECLERRLQRWHLCRHQPWLLSCETGLRGIMGGDCSCALQQGMIGLDDEKNVCLSREGGRVLLEEVWEEIVGMHGRGKKMYAGNSMETSACVGEEEEEEGTCDVVGRMLEEDLTGGPFHTKGPDNWAFLQVEKGELGLDLERLIFKDLIDRVIRDLGLSILPTTKRQLFKLHK